MTAPLLAAVVAASVLLVAWERTLVRRGFTPRVIDTLEVWAHQRRDASGDHRLVIIGSSRPNAALVPEVLEEELPSWHVVNLAIDGTAAFPVLRELAADPGFRGTVLCEVTPGRFFAPAMAGERATWATRWSRLPWISRLETPMRAWMQARLAVLLPKANLLELLWQARAGDLLAAPRRGSVMNERRFAPRRYQGIDRDEAAQFWARKIRSFKMPTPAGREAHLAALRGYIAAIERRGGKVILFRMNSTREVFAAEEEVSPRARTWDVLVEGHAAALHFSDVPELASFDCPDGSHIDARDTVAYTRVLARTLRDRGWIGPGEPVRAPLPAVSSLPH